MSSVYERVKADLDYLQLGRAAECFAALADQASKEQWSHVEYLARVAAEQAAATMGRRLAARLRFARFPFRRTIDEFDFDFQPSIDRKLVADLATLRFIPEARPVLFLGQPGCGKTHLAVALAIKAVEAGYRGYFTTGDDLAATLTQARREGTFNTKLQSYTAPTVLVIDDVGLLPMDRAAAAGFFHVVNSRYEKATPRSSPPTGACRNGVTSSATPSSPAPSSTGSSTRQSYSTSKGRPGACGNTPPSPSSPSRPTPRIPTTNGPDPSQATPPGQSYPLPEELQAPSTRTSLITEREIR